MGMVHDRQVCPSCFGYLRVFQDCHFGVSGARNLKHSIQAQSDPEQRPTRAPDFKYSLRRGGR